METDFHQGEYFSYGRELKILALRFGRRWSYGKTFKHGKCAHLSERTVLMLEGSPRGLYWCIGYVVAQLQQGFGFLDRASTQEKRNILQVAPKGSCLPTNCVLLNTVTTIMSSCEGAPRASAVGQGPEDYSNCTARIKCMTSVYLQDMNKNNRTKGKMQSQEQSASQKKGSKPREREMR